MLRGVRYSPSADCGEHKGYCLCFVCPVLYVCPVLVPCLCSVSMESPAVAYGYSGAISILRVLDIDDDGSCFMFYVV